MNTAKRVPQRTCVGCRSTSGKRGLVRVVRMPEGAVEVDPGAKRAGRGAYVCARASCWQEALKKDKLARALRTTISAADYAALRRYAEQFESAAVSV